MKDVLLSVGIDIGTSTTQVVFSHITLQDMSNGMTVPRVEIVGKEVIYRSEVHFTPLTSPTQIDAAAVRQLVDAEYHRAGVDTSSVATGAVVITGETARKSNANQVLQALSDFAGDFVVATAGPVLESIMAGRGAGADAYSKVHGTSVANYDIGGGTSNFALFDQGHLASASCLDVGGRLVKVDRPLGIVTYVAPKMAELAASKHLTLRVGDRATVRGLKPLATAMCELLEMSLGLVAKSAYYPRCLTEPGKDVVLPVPVKHLSLSGGVADLLDSQGADADPFRFGDIGLLLGQAIAQSEPLTTIPRLKAAETIRATVVGAGTHTTEVTGSTIEYCAEALPIKNLPIIKLDPAESTPSALVSAVATKLDYHRIDGAPTPVAIAFAGPVSPTFQHVVELAKGLIKASTQLREAGFPLVVVTENDLAKVLGQTIRRQLGGADRLVCIDAVRVEGGDYIDIGTPAAGGTVLPVVVKTLAFT
jgi:ethanolamine utilization protein EutA